MLSAPLSSGAVDSAGIGALEHCEIARFERETRTCRETLGREDAYSSYMQEVEGIELHGGVQILLADGTSIPSPEALRELRLWTRSEIVATETRGGELSLGGGPLPTLLEFMVAGVVGNTAYDAFPRQPTTSGLFCHRAETRRSVRWKIFRTSSAGRPGRSRDASPHRWSSSRQNATGIFAHRNAASTNSRSRSSLTPRAHYSCGIRRRRRRFGGRAPAGTAALPAIEKHIASALDRSDLVLAAQLAAEAAILRGSHWRRRSRTPSSGVPSRCPTTAVTSLSAESWRSGSSACCSSSTTLGRQQSSQISFERRLSPTPRFRCVSWACQWRSTSRPARTAARQRLAGDLGAAAKGQGRRWGARGQADLVEAFAASRLRGRCGAIDTARRCLAAVTGNPTMDALAAGALAVLATTSTQPPADTVPMLLEIAGRYEAKGDVANACATLASTAGEILRMAGRTGGRYRALRPAPSLRRIGVLIFSSMLRPASGPRGLKDLRPAQTDWRSVVTTSSDHRRYSAS